MSVIVRGMDMPSSCYECQLLEGDSMDGLCHGENRWLDDDDWLWMVYEDGTIDYDKPVNCPLIEIPSGHGRLIDESKIIYHLADYQLQESPNWGANGCGDEDAYNAITACIEEIENAPTILDAEGEEE